MQDTEGHNERLTTAKRWRSVRGRSGGWSSGSAARCRGLNPATCPLAGHGGIRNPECGAFTGFSKPLRLLPFVLIEGIFQGLNDRRDSPRTAHAFLEHRGGLGLVLNHVNQRKNVWVEPDAQWLWSSETAQRRHCSW